MKEWRGEYLQKDYINNRTFYNVRTVKRVENMSMQKCTYIVLRKVYSPVSRSYRYQMQKYSTGGVIKFLSSFFL